MKNIVVVYFVSNNLRDDKMKEKNTHNFLSYVVLLITFLFYSNSHVSVFCSFLFSFYAFTFIFIQQNKPVSEVVRRL